jgi:plastocyanin
MQKVEGNVQFHTARSTAFPQPAPGSAPSPGPMKVSAETLRSVLGISSVTNTHQDRSLAIVDATLPPAPSAQSRTISIGNFAFNPANIEVPVGTQLTWSNEDDVPHTIVSTDGGPVIKSPPLDTDQKFTTVLERPGTYRYFCSLHPHMTGTIVVR